MCQAMDQAWGLDGVPGQDLLVPRLANLFLHHLDPRHGAMVHDCDQGWAPFAVSVLRLELAALLRKLDLMSEHGPEIQRRRRGSEVEADTL